MKRVPNNMKKHSYNFWGICNLCKKITGIYKKLFNKQPIHTRFYVGKPFIKMHPSIILVNNCLLVTGSIDILDIDILFMISFIASDGNTKHHIASHCITYFVRYMFEDKCFFKVIQMDYVLLTEQAVTSNGTWFTSCTLWQLNHPPKEQYFDDR